MSEFVGLQVGGWVTVGSAVCRLSSVVGSVLLSIVVVVIYIVVVVVVVVVVAVVAVSLCRVCFVRTFLLVN